MRADKVLCVCGGFKLEVFLGGLTPPKKHPTAFWFVFRVFPFFCCKTFLSESGVLIGFLASPATIHQYVKGSLLRVFEKCFV